MRDAKSISTALDEIATLLALSGESRFKTQAYERGASVVAQLGAQLGTRVEQGRLTDIEGIGAGLAKQITELWQTGQSELLTRLRSEQPPGAFELAQIDGMTARRIRAVYDALAVTSVEELREACAAQRVRGLKGFGPKVEQSLLAAVDKWLARGEATKRILLADAHVIWSRLHQQLSSLGYERGVELAGAARRGEEVVSELDLVVEAQREPLITQLVELEGVVGVDAEDEVVQLVEGVPARLHLTTAERRGASFLLATGTDEHLDGLRRRADARGFELTREGLRARSSGELVHGDEAALYRALDLAWVPPELRVGGDELELAQRDDFADLLDVDDLCGMVHCHTTHSDGRNSIEEMARAAQAMGMKYITITDHSPSAHYARGVELDRLKRQWDEIASVQEHVEIRILRGTESDILVDGALDYPDAVLEQLDIVITSIHSRFRLSREKMTDRLVRAMSLPLFKVWGHALGRMLLDRDPIDCDVPSVLDALASSRGAIELNGDPHRLDLPPAWIPQARARGIPFVISSDAHSVPGLYAYRYGVTMARRGGLRRHEVLNTLSPDAFAARVRPV